MAGLQTVQTQLTRYMIERGHLTPPPPNRGFQTASQADLVLMVSRYMPNEWAQFFATAFTREDRVAALRALAEHLALMEVTKPPRQRVAYKPKGISKKVIRAKRNRTDAFYESDEWRALRYRALATCGGACQCCGRSKRDHGVILHVDHIKPRSLYPHLALTLTNLQVLCADCNLGKSNKDSTDWRPRVVVDNTAAA